MRRDLVLIVFFLFFVVLYFVQSNYFLRANKQKTLLLHSLRKKSKNVHSLFSSVQCLRSDNDWERFCHFENVCFDTVDRVFDFYCDPLRLPLLYAGPKGMTSISKNSSSYGVEKKMSQLQIPLQLNYDKFYWEKSLLPIRLVPLQLDKWNSTFDDKVVHVVFQSFWAENFGHALGDDILPVFSLLKRFDFLHEDAQIMMLGYHNLDSLSDRLRAKGFLSNLTSLVSPFPLIDMNQDILFSSSSKNRHVCVSNLLAGHGRLGLKTDRGFAWNEFIESALSRASNIWPLLRIEQELPLNSQRILVLIKHGRRSMLNYDEVVLYLRHVFGVPVQSVDPSNLSLEEQLILAQQTTVLVTPCGGISFFGAFLRKGASLVVLGFWNPDTNSSNNMEDFVWRHNTRLSASLYYDVRFEETIILPPGNVTRMSFEDFRNYGAITVNVKRMARVVDSALQFAEHGLNLQTPSFETKFQEEYAKYM